MKEDATREKGQATVEYALTLVSVCAAVISLLLALGPTVSHAFDEVVGALQPARAAEISVTTRGPIVEVSAKRSRRGFGNDVLVTVTVSESTTVTATDSQSGRSVSFSCRSTCQDTLSGVGQAAGSITATTGFDRDTASYQARR